MASSCAPPALPPARRASRPAPLFCWARLAPLPALLALATPALAQLPTDTTEAAEAARRTVRATAEWLASGVDSWFGDQPFSDGGKVSEGRFSVGVLHRRDTGTDLNVRFNARFRLPNLSQRSYFFFGRDNQRDLITDRPAPFTRQERLLPATAADTQFFAGIGRTLREDVDFRLGFRGGLKPYAQVRYSHPWQLGPASQAEFRQTVFWSLDDHLGATSALSFDRALSPLLVLRWLGAATITEKSRRIEWDSVAGAYRRFGGQRLLSTELLFSGKEGSGVALTDYGAQLKWQQPVHEDWLLGEVVVGRFWPRPDDRAPRQRVWAVGATLKMRF